MPGLFYLPLIIGCVYSAGIIAATVIGHVSDRRCARERDRAYWLAADVDKEAERLLALREKGEG